MERLRKNGREFESVRSAGSEGLGQGPGREESWGAWYSNMLRLSLCAAMSCTLHTVMRRGRGGRAVGGARGLAGRAAESGDPRRLWLGRQGPGSRGIRGAGAVDLADRSPRTDAPTHTHTHIHINTHTHTHTHTLVFLTCKGVFIHFTSFLLFGSLLICFKGRWGHRMALPSSIWRKLEFWCGRTRLRAGILPGNTAGV